MKKEPISCKVLSTTKTQRKRGSSMSNLNTELLNTLLKNESVDEFFRQLLEDAINDLLQAELSIVSRVLCKLS